MRSFSPYSKLFLTLVSALYLGCTRADVLYCEDSSDCTDPARSFCDLGGAFQASEGIAKTCIADPNSPPLVDAGPNDPDAMIVVPDATVACTTSVDCSAPLPICSGNMCEACVLGANGDSACADRNSATPFCSTDGSCRECIADSACGGITPVCNAEGVCDACSEHEDCTSGACSDSGACVVAGAIVYVSTGGADGLTCGNSPGTACKNLSGPLGAIAKAAVNKTHIVMETGTYTESQPPAFSSLTIEVAGHNAVIVAPNIPGPALSISLGADVVLSNLTINGGLGGIIGSGVACSGSDIRILNSTVAGSAASGIDAVNCNVRLEDTLVENHSGEGVVVSGGTVTILDSKIENNGKRGARITNGVIQVERSRFYSNNLGGIFIETSSFHLESTEVVNNGNILNGELTGKTGGVTIRNTGIMSPQELVHCTVSGNRTPGFDIGSAGIDCGASMSPVDVNSSISVNNQHSGIARQATSNCDVRFSAVPGLPSTMGNISGMPLFVNAAGGDYHLLANSPGIDVADPSSGVSTDIDRQLRPATGKDMGSDER